MPDILYATAPAWYEVGLVDPTMFFVRVHKSVYPEIEDKLADYSNPQFEDDHGFPDFVGIRNDAWGYGQKLFRMDNHLSDWVSWHCFIPLLGPGAFFIEQGGIDSVATTLSLLLRHLNNIETQSSCPDPQLVKINLRSPEPLIFGADLSYPMCQWVRSQVGENTDQAVGQAMIKTYGHMTGRQEAGTTRPQVWFRAPDRIDVQSIGSQSCALYPDDSFRREEAGGYRLTVSNLDSVVQQLLFLVAIAKMWTMAKKAGF